MATDAKNRRLPPERKPPVLLVGGSRPQAPFSQISICGCAPFRRFFEFSLFPAFRKNDKARRAAASVKRCSKGLGCYPNKQNLRFPASPEIVGLSVCIYKRPACQVAHGCYFRQPPTKISAKALTGTSVCATMMGN